MRKLLFSEFLNGKDVMKTKSGVKALKNSPWVTTIADVMKRCEIEADLDEMVPDSHGLNLISRKNILVSSN